MTDQALDTTASGPTPEPEAPDPDPGEGLGPREPAKPRRTRRRKGPAAPARDASAPPAADSAPPSPPEPPKPTASPAPTRPPEPLEPAAGPAPTTPPEPGAPESVPTSAVPAEADGSSEGSDGESPEAAGTASDGGRRRRGAREERAGKGAGSRPRAGKSAAPAATPDGSTGDRSTVRAAGSASASGGPGGSSGGASGAGSGGKGAPGASGVGAGESGGFSGGGSGAGWADRRGEGAGGGGEVVVRVGAEVWTGLGDGFVGRERELAGLRGDIDQAGLGGKAGAKAAARVLLVAGRPGVGRTALALRLAEEVAGRYPDGQVFLRLTAPGGEPVPAEQAARALRAALGRPPGKTLIVLDDVIRPDQLDGLLPDTSDALVVATSDGPLPGIPDVRPCTLGGLDTPAAVELLAHTIGSTRVTCDPRAAETLVQEIGGHPTALRLVAAWLAAQPTLSVADAAARLRAVSDEPLAPPAPRGGAQGELVRSFRLVYEDLPSTAARILRLLALAPAGLVDAQIASALAGCSVAAAQSTLDDFVTSALLAPGPPKPPGPPGPAASADALPPQYRVPGCFEPLLRGLLEARDRPEDVRLARARMLERTVRLLLSCGAALVQRALPDDGQPRALTFDSRATAADWLRSRLPALLASARVAVADGELDTLARRLIAAQVQALAAFPGGDAMAAERYELHGLVLDVAERRGLDREKAAALINLGDLDATAHRTERALDRYRAALVAARACEDPEAEGRVLEALGGTYQERHDPQRAADWYGRALALRQELGELGHQARLHGRIGALLTYGARYGPALREWRSAAAAYRRLGDLSAQARALTEAARVQEYAGYPEDALRTCRDALYWARKAGEHRLEAAILLRLADTLDRLGDPSGARVHRAAANHLLNQGGVPAN